MCRTTGAAFRLSDQSSVGSQQARRGRPSLLPWARHGIDQTTRAQPALSDDARPAARYRRRAGFCASCCLGTTMSFGVVTLSLDQLPLALGVGVGPATVPGRPRALRFSSARYAGSRIHDPHDLAGRGQPGTIGALDLDLRYPRPPGFGGRPRRGCRPARAGQGRAFGRGLRQREWQVIDPCNNVITSQRNKIAT